MKRLFHIADLHFGREHQPLVDAFIYQCKMDPPDLVVATGDFTQGARRQEFALAKQFFDALPSPVVGAPGNHDVPSRALDHRFFTPWQRFERALSGRVEPRLETGSLLAETLHTARRAQMRLDWSLGRVSRSDAAKLAKSLADAEQPTRVVACHHPLMAPGGLTGRARTKRGDTAAETLSEVCDLVLTGHLHRTFAIPIERENHVCWFVGASTTFSERTREEPAGFNEILINDDTLELTHFESREATRFEPGRKLVLPRKPGSGGVREIEIEPGAS